MNRNEDPSRPAQNDPSKAMDSKKEVEQSPDAKTDQDFPGYPHYPAKEDIMAQDTGKNRVDANVEGMAAGPNASGLNERYVTSQEDGGRHDVLSRAEGESDDLAATNSRDSEIGLPQNVSNDELKDGGDLPGTDLAGQ